METKNAIIKSVEIAIEDHGLLTAWVHLDYGCAEQGFGGYALDKSAGVFLRRVMEVVGVSSWDALRGKSVRVLGDHSKLIALGNIVLDKWFNPARELN